MAWRDVRLHSWLPNGSVHETVPVLFQVSAGMAVVILSYVFVFTFTFMRIFVRICSFIIH